MARWTQEGWEQLESIVFNAYLFAGFRMSAVKVMEDAKRVCFLIEKSPHIGKKIKNIYGEVRYWHPFHDGKILLWKNEADVVIFVGAYYFLPDEILV